MKYLLRLGEEKLTNQRKAQMLVLFNKRVRIARVSDNQLHSCAKGCSFFGQS